MRVQVVQLAAIAPEYQLNQPASQGRPTSDTQNQFEPVWETDLPLVPYRTSTRMTTPPIVGSQGLNQVRLALRLALGARPVGCALTARRRCTAARWGERRKRVAGQLQPGTTRRARRCWRRIADTSPRLCRWSRLTWPRSWPLCRRTSNVVIQVCRRRQASAGQTATQDKLMKRFLCDPVLAIAVALAWRGHFESHRLRVDYLSSLGSITKSSLWATWWRCSPLAWRFT